MLNNKNKLFFPKIVFDKSIQIDTKIINLYKLDWSRKEKKCNSGELELLDEYEDLLKSFRFALNDSYLTEIRRLSWNSVAEWNIQRGIDSKLKHIYLEPAVSYIETSFRLLADCVYDENEMFYYRGKYKYIIPYLFMYKFWKNQTSSNLIIKFIRISELVSVGVEMDEATYDFMQYINSELDNGKQSIE